MMKVLSVLFSFEMHHELGVSYCQHLSKPGSFCPPVVEA